jgi:putative aldouronate transport system permease protein
MDTAVSAPSRVKAATKVRKHTVWQRVWKARYLFVMFLPGFALILLFQYGPMYGLQIAFKDYNIMKGIWNSPWVGLEHFRRFFFFDTKTTIRILRNTIEISLLRIVFGFPAPIILALLINEVRDGFFKRFVQNVSYLPHFVSWVVIAALVRAMVSPSTGPINAVIKLFGIQPIYFMAEPSWFRVLLIASAIWKGVGWGAVIYLAALSNVDPMLHEAAIVDGANRLQRIWYINLPTILPVVTVVLILRMGSILNAGFDQIFNMYSTVVYEVSDIIDTYVYRAGLSGMEFSYASAVGFFKGIIGLIMVFTVNAIARRVGGRGRTLW